MVVRRSHTGGRILAVLCVAVLLCSAFAQVGHFHPNGTPDSQCTVCVALHSPTAVAAAPDILPSLGAHAHELVCLAPSPVSRTIATHSIRPPPADSRLSA